MGLELSSGTVGDSLDALNLDLVFMETASPAVSQSLQVLGAF